LEQELQLEQELAEGQGAQGHDQLALLAGQALGAMNEV